jgi:hypothetical protein
MSVPPSGVGKRSDSCSSSQRTRKWTCSPAPRTSRIWPRLAGFPGSPLTSTASPTRACVAVTVLLTNFASSGSRRSDHALARETSGVTLGSLRETTREHHAAVAGGSGRSSYICTATAALLSDRDCHAGANASTRVDGESAGSRRNSLRCGGDSQPLAEPTRRPAYVQTRTSRP